MLPLFEITDVQDFGVYSTSRFSQCLELECEEENSH